jgi:hypothetical protein
MKLFLQDWPLQILDLEDPRCWCLCQPLLLLGFPLLSDTFQGELKGSNHVKSAESLNFNTTRTYETITNVHLRLFAALCHLVFCDCHIKVPLSLVGHCDFESLIISLMKSFETMPKYFVELSGSWRNEAIASPKVQSVSPR